MLSSIYTCSAKRYLYCVSYPSSDYLIYCEILLLYQVFSKDAKLLFLTEEKKRLLIHRSVTHMLCKKWLKFLTRTSFQIVALITKW